MTKEIRVLSGMKIEARADTAPKIVGYAAVFDTETDIGGMFKEKVARGAFADVMASSDVHALFNHDENIVLGRARAGTLTMSEDDKGLYVEIEPPDTDEARDLMLLMKRGDIDQMSFAFTMQGGSQEWDETGDMPVRTILKVGELYDVSVVTRGAYPTTEAAVRSLETHRAQKNFRAASLRLRLKGTHDLASRRTAD